MIKAGEEVFVDTGAWIALAVVDDPFHPRARSTWEHLMVAGAKVRTSVPVVVETFTFLDRRGSRDLAVSWRNSLERVRRMKVLGCTAAELAQAWTYLDRKDLHKLSLVDATSFVAMRKARIRLAFAFDTHFAIAGFQLLG